MSLTMPVLPLRDVVIFPHMVIPLFVGRERSIESLEHAVLQEDKKVLLIAQRDPKQDSPAAADLYDVGTMSTILQLLKLPDGTLKVLVEGTKRGRIVNYKQSEPFLLADVEPLTEEPIEPETAEPLLRSLVSQFEQYAKLNKKVPIEISSVLSGIEEPERLVDTLTAHLAIKMQDKQALLEKGLLKDRIQLLLKLLESEIKLLQVEINIRSSVKDQIEKNQTEYYLNEQKKAIEKMLGDLHPGEGPKNENEALEKRIADAGMSKEASDKALAEVGKLKMMPALSAEATVCRNYVDWMLAVPWKKATPLKMNLSKAEKILNEDHYGLEKVKERILEHLAVQQRVKKVTGSVLCLVGPPGVGKTSLGQSIARATGRVFTKMSLGGVRDEAEIRGHRRTYIGAMPGKILQKLAKANTRNPLFLLDEVDKMAMDFRGDPASALLEVLDPEQNHLFNDHYLEVDYDLSDVMFLATANSLQIPPALLDRMEVIRLPGYTEDEKMKIATQYLLPKQMEEAGLKTEELKIADSAILEIIRYYTREAGVRALEREIAKICRKWVKGLLTKKTFTRHMLRANSLEPLLGVRRFRFGQVEETDQIGEVHGLAWTEVGGELLTIEAVTVPGKGKVTTTGKLGDVMQESIHAAVTVVRDRSQWLGIPLNFYEKNDLHVHVPEGATPKDGPSAGISMCTALVSILTHIPVRKEVAMTGEITLRGNVLPIGGLKEKLLAARRAGIKIVIIPKENMPELKDMPKNITQHLQIEPVSTIEEVLKLALVRDVSKKRGKKPVKYTKK